MPEFRPNPFKVKWEELIVKNIAEEIQHDFYIDPADGDYDVIKSIVATVIIRYKQETAKQKGIK